ncbi:MmgE/PrpD family protein [Mesorhizobium sp. M0522]|uniref:MmgE/PrpD family protein n=1 Tax=Mesorhizobium sp. M0522 TaxID=2956958 RepID=UPI00333AD4B8
MEVLLSTSGLFAKWVTEDLTNSIPSDVSEKIKLAILDGLGCVIAGMNTQLTEVVLTGRLKHSGQAGPIPLPGRRLSCGLLDATYIAGQAANALDFDDCYRGKAPCHPGATIVAPALLVAHARDCQGHELLHAITKGYEVSLRVGQAIDATAQRKKHVTGYSTWQVFGAVASAAALMRLDAGQIVNAFGLAGSQAPVPNIRKLVELPFSWLKNGYGISAEVGVLSAMLAESGLRGPAEIFDGETGFWIMSGSDRYDCELAREELGTKWLSREIEYKPYSCCQWTHTMLDCIADLRQEVPLEEVERLEIAAFVDLAVTLNMGLPDNIISAQFNARYLAALEYLGRSPANGLSTSDLGAGDIAAFAGKISLVHDPVLDIPYHAREAIPVRVTVTDKSGRRFVRALEDPVIDMTPERITEKFERLAEPVLGAAKTQRLLEAVLDIEKHSAREIVDLTVPN